AHYVHYRCRLPAPDHYTFIPRAAIQADEPLEKEAEKGGRSQPPGPLRGGRQGRPQSHGPARRDTRSPPGRVRPGLCLQSARARRETRPSLQLVGPRTRPFRL
ncbi:MAG: hypothetical protein AVDCRST_MAG78-1830, partial [uncultured Rubrobacteraceae bacterium]